MTKRNSLSGREIVTGETIIIPMAMRMFEITRSITMKGRYKRKPISKPAVNSETMKAGVTIRRSSSLMPAENSGGQILRAVDMKNSRCSGLLLRTMNLRSGWAALPISVIMVGMLDVAAAGAARRLVDISAPTGAMT